jgi:hypothetical protein
MVVEMDWVCGCRGLVGSWGEKLAAEAMQG